MGSAPIAYGGYKRTVGEFPELVQLNMLAEKAPSQQEKQVALIMRAALKNWVEIDAPLRGIFRKSGLFEGDALVVAAQTVYRLAENGTVTALSGSVPGDGRVKIDGGLDGDGNALARIVTGGQLYQTDGVTVTAENFPDSDNAGCTDICYHRQHWLGIQAGTDKVYLQLPGDTTWDPLTYASAESQPDVALAVRSLGDQVWILGAASSEAWALTGNPDDPITPYGGLNFGFGIRSSEAAVSIPGALLWIDNNATVRMTQGGAPEIVSDNGLSEQIRKVPSDELRAWGFTFDQHPVALFTLSTASRWAFDLSTLLWSRFLSAGMNIFAGHLGCDVSGSVYALSAELGASQVFRFDADLLTDDDGEIPIEWTCVIESPEGRRTVPVVEVIGSVGFVPRTGDGSAPVMQMRISRDQGKTFGNWRTEPMPVTGDFAGRVRFRQCGQITPPYGWIMQFRMTDPVVRRVTDVRLP